LSLFLSLKNSIQVAVRDFHDGPKIEVAYKVDGSHDNKAELHIAVSDTRECVFRHAFRLDRMLTTLPRSVVAISIVPLRGTESKTSMRVLRKSNASR
jgi:hypothetical protein